MGSIGRRPSPGKGDAGGTGKAPRSSYIEEEVISALDGITLDPAMSRTFDYQTVMYILEEVLPAALADKNLKVAKVCEEVLAKHGLALPNHLTGRWTAMEIPRNELQVRELFAGRLYEYGYQLVTSHTEFPDWLLLDKDGGFVYAEVEHRSSAFVSHGHDPKLCDLIVCWEHDWTEHNLPVLEFFSGQIYGIDHPPHVASRAALAVNLSGALARHAYGEVRASKRARASHTIERYEALLADGKTDTEAIRLLSLEIGTTKSGVRAVLDRRNLRERKPSGTRTAQACERVSALMLSGFDKRAAIKKTAEEFNITTATVHTYLSRNRNT